MIRAAIASALLISLLAAGCGGGESEQAEPAGQTSAASTTPTTTGETHALVGRWERVLECEQLLKAFQDAGLGELAPAFIPEYFPNANPKELARKLARKDDPCEGAKPFVHSHFFTETGAFGSLTENLQQVDDGMYEIIDERTFVITNANVRFHYRIEGDQLVLTPVLTRAMKREALEHPFAFSRAGGAIALSYPGQVWQRVDCSGWC